VKTISLVFDYDFNKQKESGRVWAEKGYKSKDFIFEYSAASFASFLYKNPNRVHIVDTDDVDLLHSKIKKYNVNYDNLDIRDSSDLISEWKSNEYCFFPLLAHIKYHAELSKESVVKLDNDLTCLKSIDELEDFSDILAWKFERNVSNGRDYWGEKYVCNTALGTDDFDEYNTGVLGISKNNLEIVDEFISVTEKLISVDASSVIRFKSHPGQTSKVYATSDQTAVNWVFHNNGLKVTETDEYFFHHCYAIDAKKNCIKESQVYLKDGFQ
jgi:hypothetical protein